MRSRPRFDVRPRTVLAACLLLATVLLVSPSLVPGFPADCVDGDGDGYGAFGDPSCPNGPAVDCDDTNGDVYPGAPETCDGVNNDCDQPNWPWPFSWTEGTITALAAGATSVHAADVDGDDDVDALSASVYGDRIAWYENTQRDGSAWTEHVISTSADGAQDVYAADIDGDDDLDVLSASYVDDRILWYENTDGDGSVWVERTISTSADGAASVLATDLDGDGDQDVLSASSHDDKIAWYENTAGDGSTWTEHVISTSAVWATSVFVANVDGDADKDVLSSSSVDGKIAWYENTAGDGSAWTERVISTSASGAGSVVAADLDGDADMDVVAAANTLDTIAWYENTAGDGSAWTERTISTSTVGAWAVFAADVDGDADIDILSASHDDDTIAWHENAAGDGSAWTARTISTAADNAWAVFAINVDGDDDIDVLSASWDDGTIAWYEHDRFEGDLDEDGVAICEGDCDDTHPNCISNCTDVDGDGIPYCADTCLDHDGDGHGDPGGWGDTCTAPDCDDANPHCTTDCTDSDGDGVCVTTDCSDADPNNWASCGSCADGDGDTFFAGCDAYVTIDGPDCDDGNAACTDDCEIDLDGDAVPDCADTCVDADDDGYGDPGGSGNDCAGPDCNDTDPNNWVSCAECLDLDGDGYFDGCDAYLTLDGPDCDDADPDNWISCGSCIDSDGDAAYVDCDAYGEINGPDCDDSDDAIYPGAPELCDGVNNDCDHPTWPETYSWSERPIASHIGGAGSAIAAHIDGDDDLDVVATDDSMVLWFYNQAGDGSTWVEEIVSAAPVNPVAVFAADMDGDGDTDLLSADNADDRVRLHRNSGGYFQYPVPISSSAYGVHSVFAADVDGDNDLDALSASAADDKIAWYENVSGSASTWDTHVISTSADGASSVFAADLDGDDDVDVLSASPHDDKIAWYENTAGNGSAWTEHPISGTADGARTVFAADLDGDDDLDVLSTSFSDATVAWYENTAGDGSAWVEREISVTATGAEWLFVADMDGDDDLDVLATDLSGYKIAWFENVAGDGSIWKERGVSLSPSNASSVFAADLDGDQILEILFSDFDDEKIAFYDQAPFEGDQDEDGIAVCDGDCDDENPNCVTDCETDLDVDGIPDCADTCIDNDRDGYGDPGGSGNSCLGPDCDDTNEYCTTDCTDLDGDGYCVTTDCDDDKLHCNLDCTDVDGDGFCITVDCDDTDPNNWNWISCIDCADADGDTYFVNCDAYITIDGPDCDDDNPDCTAVCTDDDGDGVAVCAGDCGDSDPNNWISCASCVDVDVDTYFTGCDAYLTIDGPDCDDSDADVHPGATELCDGLNNDCDNPFWPQVVVWGAQELSSSAEGALAVYGADVDGDDDPDILSASQNDDEIAWFENTAGDGTAWTEHTISSSMAGASSVFAADLDGDDDVDVLAAAGHEGRIAWFENTAGDGSAWTTRTISWTADGANSVFAVDVDGDGDADVLSASWSDSTVAWYENTAGDGSAWTERQISTSAMGARSVFAADVDGDDDVDVLSASWDDDTIAWFENTAGDGSAWTEREISTSADGASAVFALDLDGDNDVDVLSASYLDDRIAWYENTAGDGSAWTERNISTSADGAGSVFAVDMDGDADVDVLSASFADDKVAWYENTTGDGSTWKEQVISSTSLGASGVFAADIDGDADSDVLAASWADDAIVLHRQDNAEYDDDGDGLGECEGDCDDANPNCVADCTDLDEDGFCTTHDCDDLEPGCTVDCTDGDGDELALCAGDCDDANPDCTIDCTDADGDGLALCAGDCDDANPNCVSDCTDDDGDGFCVTHDCDDTIGSCTVDCTDADSDGVMGCEGDCDDTHPDCIADCTDADGDGLALCAGDCDDVNPNCTTDCTDDDGDGYCVIHDCDDTVGSCTEDCADDDGDGVRACEGDCDDTDPQSLPGLREVCTDSADNDCNGLTDHEDPECAGLVVPNLRFGPEGNHSLAWDAAPDAATYGLYRGTLGSDGMQGFDHLCEATLIVGTSAADPDLPPRREGFYYLVAGQRTDGDAFVTGPMGLSSAASSRPDSQTITCGPRVYVDPDVAVGSNDGLSWATAYTGVVVALQHEPFGERGLEVWIRGALHENAAVNAGNRAGAELLGGFAGTEQASWERSPETTPTTWDPVNANNPLLSVAGASVLLDALTMRNGSAGVAGVTTSPLVEFRKVRVDQLAGYGIDMIFDGPGDSRLNVQDSTFTSLGGGAIRATARGGLVTGLVRRNTVDGAGDAAMRLDARPYSEDAEMRLDLVANVISGSQTGVVLTAEVPDKPRVAVQASFLGSNLVYDTTGSAVVVESLGDFSVASGPAEARAIPSIVGNTLSDGGGPAVLVTATRTDGTGNELQHPVRAEPQVWDNLITYNADAGIEESADDPATGLVSDPVIVGNDLFGNPVYYRDEGVTDLTDMAAVNGLPGAYDNFDADPAYVNRPVRDYHLSGGTVLGIGSEMRYLANSADPGIGMTWVEPGFDDAGWSHGAYGVGYDTGPPPNAQALLRTTVPVTTRSVYTRIPFTVPDASEVTDLTLGVDFDDGFSAWINGVEVYRSAGLPAGPLDWTAGGGPHESSNGDLPVYEMFNIAVGGIPALVDGANVLAIGVWNETVPSDDLVLVPLLIIDQEYETTDAGHLEAPRVAREDIDGDRRSIDGDRDGVARPDTGADER